MTPDDLTEHGRTGCVWFSSHTQHELWHITSIVVHLDRDRRLRLVGIPDGWMGGCVAMEQLGWTVKHSFLILSLVVAEHKYWVGS